MNLSVKNGRTLLILFTIFVFIALVNLLAITLKGDRSKSFLEPNKVPEISLILNSNNQDFKQKEARALAERLGPDKALELLNNSGIPFTGEGHIIIHEIGYVAYHKWGKEALLHCKDYFLYACYHGAIIEAAASSGGGISYIKEMTDRCRDAWGKFVQCVHAVGHGLMALWDYDLPKSLSDCDRLFERETQYKDALIHCHDGVFMENIFGIHGLGVRTASQRKWLSETDIYFPCDAVSEKYQQGCWFNQASRIYEMKGENIKATAAACEGLESAVYKGWCFNNLARQISPLGKNNIDKVFALCNEVGDSWAANCEIVSATSYFSQGGRDLAIQICYRLAGAYQDECFKQIIPMIGVDTVISKSEKEAMCKVMGKFTNNCLVDIKSLQ